MDGLSLILGVCTDSKNNDDEIVMSSKHSHLK